VDSVLFIAELLRITRILLVGELMQRVNGISTALLQVLTALHLFSVVK
jgi:hypothetical protein